MAQIKASKPFELRRGAEVIRTTEMKLVPMWRLPSGVHIPANDEVHDGFLALSLRLDATDANVHVNVTGGDFDMFLPNPCKVNALVFNGNMTCDTASLLSCVVNNGNLNVDAVTVDECALLASVGGDTKVNTSGFKRKKTDEDPLLDLDDEDEDPVVVEPVKPKKDKNKKKPKKAKKHKKRKIDD